MLNAELRQYIREERSKVQKEKYLRERKLSYSFPKPKFSTIMEKSCALDECAKRFMGKTNKIYCSSRCASRASYLKHKEREKEGDTTTKRKCENDDCPNEFIGRDFRQRFCSQSCKDKDYYRRKGKALRKLREREEQLERLAGY